MYKAEICLNIPGKSWDGGVIGSLRFKNKKRLNHFSVYYTNKVDCLIRVYWDNEWMCSYLKGKDIWNRW